MKYDSAYLSGLRNMSLEYLQRIADKANLSELLESANQVFCPQAYKVIRDLSGEEFSMNLKSIDELAFICSTLNKSIDSHRIYTSSTRADYMNVDNSALYYKLRSAIAANEFSKNDSKWLTADLSSKSLKAIAQAKPPKEIEVDLTDEGVNTWQDKIYSTIYGMNDVTADIVDIICSECIENENKVILSADDFLRARGIKPKKSGAVKSTALKSPSKIGLIEANDETHWRGGYHIEQRRQIAQHIEALDQLWIIVHEMEVTEVTKHKRRRVKKTLEIERKAIYVTGRATLKNDKSKAEDFMWELKLGEILADMVQGPGKQIARNSRQALKYNPYTQKIEKRLYRYFVWLWRIRQSSKSYLQPFSVASLLKEAKYTVDNNNPSNTKERLEKALDTLQEDNLIAHWQYESVNEKIIGKKGWVNEWKKWKVIIEPPREIVEIYNNIKNYSPVELVPSEGSHVEFDYTEIKKAMEEKGRNRGLGRDLKLSEAAHEIGEISVSRLSRIARGDATTPETKERIIRWIKGG